MIAHALIIIAGAIAINAAHEGNIQRGLDKHVSRIAITDERITEYCEARGVLDEDLRECLTETRLDLKIDRAATLEQINAELGAE